MRPLVIDHELTPAELSVRETSAFDPDPSHGRFFVCFRALLVALICVVPLREDNEYISFDLLVSNTRSVAGIFFPSFQIKLQPFSD